MPSKEWRALPGEKKVAFLRKKREDLYNITEQKGAKRTACQICKKVKDASNTTMVDEQLAFRTGDQVTIIWHEKPICFECLDLCEKI